MSGRPILRAFEIDELGPLDGMRVLHLQCHLGLEALDLARIHPTVRVTGLDSSAPAVDAAARLAGEVRLADRARFVVGDVHHAGEVLGGERFDVVYTGKGALSLLPDVDHWASVVHDLLEPGGFLYLNEVHPVANVLADDRPLPEHDYFATAPLAMRTTAQWQHPIARVLTAVLGAGLQIELFHEWGFSLLDRFGYLVAGDDGARRWPGPGTLPLMYSLKAIRGR